MTRLRLDSLERAIMTDLEITRLCAEAMRIQLFRGNILIRGDQLGDKRLISERDYNPLNDDAQAMAMVRDFGLSLYRYFHHRIDGDIGYWQASDDSGIGTDSKNLNRAICECVAKMQRATQA